MMDSLVLQESYSDGANEGFRGKVKTIINKSYGKINTEGSSNDDSVSYGSSYDQNMQPPVYLEGDEKGFPGLEPPMG